MVCVRFLVAALVVLASVSVSALDHMSSKILNDGLGPLG